MKTILWFFVVSSSNETAGMFVFKCCDINQALMERDQQMPARSAAGRSRRRRRGRWSWRSGRCRRYRGRRNRDWRKKGREWGKQRKRHAASLLPEHFVKQLIQTFAICKGAQEKFQDDVPSPLLTHPQASEVPLIFVLENRRIRAVPKAIADGQGQALESWIVMTRKRTGRT